MENGYSYILTGKENCVAIIELNQYVLGGNEALDFASKLDEIATKNVKCIVVNLKKVEAMNSSGLGMLVSGLSTMRKHDIELILAGVPKKIMELLQMTHLVDVFKIFDSIEDALKGCE